MSSAGAPLEGLSLEGLSLAEQAARRSTARLVAARAEEAQALMDAAAAVMVRYGTERRATVAEIVREAGLSNQAFYRHFASKDDLVAAIVDAGARRLASYARHGMDGVDDPADQVRVWIRAVLSQAIDPAVAHATRAINWNSGALVGQADANARQAQALVWAVLEEPLADLGATDPPRDAYLVGKLVFSVMAEALWDAQPPGDDDVARVEAFCLAGLNSRVDGAG